MLRIGASSGAHDLRTIAGIPSGPLNFEVSSWRRVWRTLRVEHLMGDIVNFEGGKWCGWSPWSFRLELEATTDAKRLALDEGLVEIESELPFSGGKDDWQKFWETTLAIDQKEREPAWQEAIFLLMRWTKDDLAFLMALEQVLPDWMKEVLSVGFEVASIP